MDKARRKYRDIERAKAQEEKERARAASPRAKRARRKQAAAELPKLAMQLRAELERLDWPLDLPNNVGEGVPARRHMEWTIATLYQQTFHKADRRYGQEDYDRWHDTPSGSVVFSSSGKLKINGKGGGHGGIFESAEEVARGTLLVLLAWTAEQP